MALSGTLDSFALPDVLRLLASTKKTGRLRVTGGRGSGSVWVDDGEIVSTELTSPGTVDPTQSEVVFGLLRFGTGSFTFEAEAKAVNAGPPEQLEPILVTAEHMLTEWRAIEEIVPSLDVHVTLSPEPGGGDVMIDTPRWRCIAAVAGGATAGEIGSALGQSEMEVCRTIKELVELGLLEIGETPPVVDSHADPVAPAVAEPVEPEPVESEPVEPEPVESELVSAEPVEPAPEDPGIEEPVTEEPVLETAPDHDSESSADVGLMDLGSAESFAATTMSDPSEPIVTTAPGLAGLGPADEESEPASFLSAGQADFVEPEDGPGTMDETTGDGTEPDPILSEDADSGLFGAANGADAIDSDVDPAEMARQLASLSPKAAKAVAAAAKASTDAERDAALAAVEAEDETVNRGLLLKFLGSVDG